MGYTRFALDNLVVPGNVMPKCSGERVFSITLGPARTITMTTTTEACLFVVVPRNYDNKTIAWDLSKVSPPMKRYRCNEASIILQPNTTHTVLFDVGITDLHVYTYDCPAGFSRYYPYPNTVPNCSSVTCS
jgi:hypothetical protein